MTKFKVGQKIRVIDKNLGLPLYGKVGTVVQINKDGMIGIDFGEQISSLTWNLSNDTGGNLLDQPHGRYLYPNNCKLVIGDWDE